MGKEQELFLACQNGDMPAVEALLGKGKGRLGYVLDHNTQCCSVLTAVVMSVLQHEPARRQRQRLRFVRLYALAQSLLDGPF